MNNQDIKAPVPLRNKKLTNLKKNVAEGSLEKVMFRSRTPGISSPPLKSFKGFRARSVTPTYANSEYGIQFEKDIVNERLDFYNLNFPEDKDEFEKSLYNPKSKWFSRSIKPKFQVEKYLPYEIETHQERARYLSHVLVNLYIAISSLDIQGLVSITSKDLADLKNEIDDLALKTDLFRLSDGQPHLDSDGKLVNFQESELYDENDFIRTQTPDINITGKITAKSVTIINVNHWTNELRSCLTFDFPLTLRKSLATVFFHLSLVRGQSIPRDLFVEIFEILVDDYDEGTNYTELLKNAGLVLDHKELFDFLCAFLPYPDSDYVKYDLSSKEDLALYKLLLKLARYSKPFFYDKDELLLKGSMDVLLSSFSPTTISAILPIITSFIPHHYSKDRRITDYFPFFYGLWTSVSATVTVDTHLYELVGDIAEDVYRKICEHGKQGMDKVDITFGKFGIFTEDQMAFMFNRLQGHLRTDGQIHSYSRTVRPFIYSINGRDHNSFFEILAKLIMSIKTYIYPSNSGFWTKPIAKFIHCFIKMYHGRAQYEIEEKNKIPNREICLTEECNDRVIDLFLNLLTTGAQNKDHDITNFYISSFAYILDLSSSKRDLIFDRVLEDVYDFCAGEFINSRHRVVSSLKQFTRAARFMASDKLYRVHITNILSSLVLKIDPNDMALTGLIVNAIVAVCSFIPIKLLVSEDDFLTFESHTVPFIQQQYFHMKESPGDKFIYDQNILDSAFRASSTAFNSFLKVYVDKLFCLVDTELDDGFIIKLNQTTMIMIESMDTDMFECFCGIFLRMFWDNEAFKVKDPNYEIVSIPLAALVRRDQIKSRQIIETLMINIREQIERGAGSVRNYTEIHPRDVKLVLYLTSMNDVLRQSHKEILEMKAELIEFVKYIYETISNPPLNMLTSILSHSILASLTTTEITKCLLFQEDSDIPDDDKWGGLQFDNRKYENKNLQFEWHVPSDEEISLAIQFFEEITNYCTKSIDRIIEVPLQGTKYADDIQKYIFILTHAISGASLLFDPDFNKNKYITSTLPSYRERLLLLKQVRENNCDNSELNVDIEQILSGKDEEEYISDINSIASEPSDIVVIGDENGTDDFVMDDTVSEVPSAIGTPVSGEIGGSSLMNSGLVFRDLDIYKSNYYFGVETSEKMRNPMYCEVHRIRSKIGLFFHKMFEYLSDNIENNTTLYQVLLHGLKVWFMDVGQESLFSDDPGAFLDVEFFENVQSLSNKEECFTRTYLAVKADTYHRNRVLLHSTNRYPSKLEIQLLKDIIQLATSTYPDIYQVGQATLAHCMKQLIGSYSIIIKQTIDLLRKYLDLKDYPKVDSILRLLFVRKLRRKVVNDYNNMEDVLLLLINCSDIKDLDIGLKASNVISDFVANLKIPSSVCTLQEHIYSILEPPEQSIGLQVNAVRTAKKRKRAEIMEKLRRLQDNLLTLLSTNNTLNWRVLALIIRLVSRIESDLETKTNQKVFETILLQSYKGHPEIIHLALKSSLSIFNKFLSLSDYKYDNNKAYDLNFDPSFIYSIQTNTGHYSEEFRRELSDYETPSYFIDSKSFVGWLCWGSTMKVLKTEQCLVGLERGEISVLKEVVKIITTDLIKHITMTLIRDNESRGSFSSGNVSFFTFLLFLADQYGGQMTVTDIFKMCTNYYDTMDKASIILSVEIVAGLVCGKKYLSEETGIEIDIFLEKFLQDCLDKEINKDAFEVWCTLCWWLPSVVDIRRSKPICNYFFNISNLLNDKFDDASHQSCRLNMLNNMLTTLGYRSFGSKVILASLMFDHPYDQVRRSIAKVFTTVIKNESYLSYESTSALLMDYSENQNEGKGLGLPIKGVPVELDKMVKNVFETTFIEYAKVKHLAPKEILNTKYYYMASTLFYWINDMCRSPTRILLVPYIEGFVIPFLVNLVSQKDVCIIAGIDPTKIFLSISHMPFRRNFLELVMNQLCKIVPINSSYQIRVQLSSIEYLLSAQLLQLSKKQIEQIYEFVLYELYNKSFIEVRIRAAALLSDLVHNLGMNDTFGHLLNKFNKELNKIKHWEEKKRLSKKDINLHASVLGVGAIISAFPYEFPLPEWIPKELSYLSSWARTTGMVGTSAKNTINEFKKVRVDTWVFDRTRFTSDELENLEGVLWRSYYA